MGSLPRFKPHHAALLTLALLLSSCSNDSSSVIRRLPFEPGASPGILSLAPGATSLGFIGETVTISAQVLGANGKPATGLSFLWKSTNPAVAAVDQQGRVTAKAEGTAQIVARVVNLADTATITVKRVASSVSLSETSLLFTELGVASTVQAAVVDGGGQSLPSSDVVWSSGDTTVATVSQTGTITAVGQGSTSVKATAGAVQALVTVRVATGPSSITVTPSPVTLNAVGDTVRLVATVLDAAGGTLDSVTVTFTDGDTLIATVDSTGLVTSIADGTTALTVIGDTVRTTVLVTVNQVPAAVVVSPDGATLTPGGTIDFTLTATDSNGVAIPNPAANWSSTDVTVASVTGTGSVTGLAAGSSLIIGTSGSAADTAVVTVVVVPVDSVDATPDSLTLVAGASSTLSARFFDDQKRELLGPTASWASRDQAVATVTSTGVVTAVAEGTTWIDATVDNGADSTFVTVTPAPGPYNLEVRYVGTTPSADVVAAFATAEARWEEIIVGDLSDVSVTLDASDCGIGHPAVNETIDDVVIFAEVTAIDGSGGVLGQAGPCIVRSVGGLAIVGTMQFDEADLADLLASGDLSNTILHEMGHVLGLGLGTPWTDVLVDAGGADPYWPGTEAVNEYDLASGTATNKVPVANTGGSGTADSHWRESDMGRELMTGFLNSGVPNPLSAITIGAMDDMGYTVDVAKADAYTVSAVFRLAPDRLIQLRELPVRPPLAVDASGNVVGRRRP
jgi:uncharacterized protein YjdB